LDGVAKSPGLWIALGVLGRWQLECAAVSEFPQGLEAPSDLSFASHIAKAKVVTDSSGQLGAVHRSVTVEEPAHGHDRFWLREDSFDLILFWYDGMWAHQQRSSSVRTDRGATVLGLC
jgi:hypothetical protein